MNFIDVFSFGGEEVSLALTEKRASGSLSKTADAGDLTTAAPGALR